MINISGLPELQRKLDSLVEKTQKTIVKSALRETVAEILLPAARRNAPVLTGALREGLAVIARTSRGTIGAAIQSAEYTGDQYYGSFSEFGTRHEPAKPWLRPALDENEDRLLAAAGEKIGRGIEGAAK